MSFSSMWRTMLQLALNSYDSFSLFLKAAVYYDFSSLLGNLAWLHVPCSVSGEEEDLLVCWYAEINQNILTNILAGFQSAWLFGALSDSRMMSFRTDVKLIFLATCTVKRELGPSACMGGFWVKVELSAQKLSTFGVLHELDRHARAYCIVCVCANTLLPFSLPFSPLPFPLSENAATDVSQGPGESWHLYGRCANFPSARLHGLTLSETFF